MNRPSSVVYKSAIAAALTIFLAACIGGEPAPDGVPSAVMILSLVDGVPVPAAAGSTSAGVAMIAKNGTISGDVDGTDCAYTIIFEESGTGAIVSQHADLTRQQCPLSNGTAITIETSFKRGDLPVGSHKYEFSPPSWRSTGDVSIER